jgi:hypothetical protein
VDGFNGAGCGNSGGVITGPPECLGRHDEENSAHDLAIAGFASAALFGGAAALLYLTDRGAQSPAERLGVGLTVAGVAALAIGITAQMVTERHISAFNENQCTNNHGTIDGPPTCSSIEDKETLARKVAYSSYAGAALLGLGGAALLVVTSRGADVPSTTSTAIRCVPAIGGSVGASCNMRF